MGRPGTPHARRRRWERRGPSPRQPGGADDALNDALGAIAVLGLEPGGGELEPHLTTVLSSITEKGAAERVAVSGVLPVLALSLRRRSPLAAKLVAELAGEAVVRRGFADAGLVPAVLSLLTAADQELLLHAATAVSRMCHDSPTLQELLLRHGAVPRLVAALLRFPAVEPLEGACLLALCNLSGMGLAEGAGLSWERGVSVRPGESLFHAVSPHACGFAVSLIQVRVTQWAPGQYKVNAEVTRRYSSGFWSLCGNAGDAKDPGTDWKTRKVSKFPPRNVPPSKSLKTRMFHTFL